MNWTGAWPLTLFSTTSFSRPPAFYLPSFVGKINVFLIFHPTTNHPNSSRLASSTYFQTIVLYRIGRTLTKILLFCFTTLPTAISKFCRSLFWPVFLGLHPKVQCSIYWNIVSELLSFFFQSLSLK